MSQSARHQCLIYHGAPSSHLADVTPTLIQWRQANYRCLYLNSPAMVAGMRSRLSAAGLNVEEEVRRGAIILSSNVEHLVEGKLEPGRIMALLNGALADGFAGLWAAGDITWEFGADVNSQQLMEYEQHLETLMQGNPALCAICLYHRETLPKQAVLAGLQTHQVLYVNAALSQLNPQFVAA